MPSNEDWLQDPLMEISRGSYQFHKLKSLDEKKYQEWPLFHYSTRLKLNGAKFFCTKVIDTESTSEDELRWYLDAFLFELMAACDMLLQEINVVYNLGIDIDEVSWRTTKDELAKSKLASKLGKYMEEERGKEWFCEVQRYRNQTTHHYRTPITSSRRHGSPHLTNVCLQYIDKEGKIKISEIIICKDYLSNMVNYISSVWGKMAQEFERGEAPLKKSPPPSPW